VTDIVYGVYIDWDNNGSVLAGSPTTGEDVTARVLGLRTPVGWGFGRDTMRSLGDLLPGTLSLELNNKSQDYSPDYVSSPLYGKLGSGKPIQITATLSGTTYYLFYGFLDDYNMNPGRLTKSVSLTAFDGIARASGNTITTGLYQSLRTGDAINVVLDAIGWPTAQRDIDPGATTIRWFWEDASDAQTSLKDIVASEGGPAILYADGHGNIVFRDRHHRFIRTKSLTSQASFTDGSTASEPAFCEPVTYNIGFRDLINSVTFSVDEREPQAQTAIWSTSDSYTITPGAPLVLAVKGSDPFYGAITPVAGTDYTLVSGSVNVSLSTDNGQSTNITISASTTAYITGMQLRATPVAVARTYSISAQNSSSIAKYGTASYPDSAPLPKWAGRNDVAALANVILAQRSERLPVISITVNSGNDTRKTQILSRTLSDRIHITEPYSGTNADHFIEKIDQSIGQVGQDHRITMGCERVRSVTGTQFTFDVAGAGFDQGSFGLPGFDDASSIFILGSAVAGHRLGSGKLAT
jgi:hypothetical protein